MFERRGAQLGVSSQFYKRLCTTNIVTTIMSENSNQITTHFTGSVTARVGASCTNAAVTTAPAEASLVARKATWLVECIACRNGIFFPVVGMNEIIMNCQNLERRLSVEVWLSLTII